MNVKTESIRPRNYGEPTDRGFEKAMDALTDWVAFYRSARSKVWEEVQARSTAEAFVDGLPASDYAEEYQVQKLAYKIAGEGLLVAEPFWITCDVSRLLALSYQELPAIELRPSDLLVPNGFVLLEGPITDFYDENIPLYAFAWTTQEYRGRRKVLTTAFTEVPGVSEILFPGDGEAKDYDFPIARLVVAFWMLSQQKLLATSRRKVSRAVRRRAKSQKIEDVVVVQLRRNEYPETNGSRKVDWTHQWLVRGFWRRQWYPSEGRHRPVWIADYVKGPPDKPFIAKRRAFEVVR